MAKRRGHGEGSIYHRPNGRWCATLDLRIMNGKRKHKYLYGEIRREVVEKLKAAQHAQALRHSDSGTADREPISRALAHR